MNETTVERLGHSEQCRGDGRAAGRHYDCRCQCHAAQCVTYLDGGTGPCDAHDPRRGRQPGLYVVFDGPPSHESGRFVEVEDETGASVGAGKWRREGDMWALGPFHAALATKDEASD